MELAGIELFDGVAEPGRTTLQIPSRQKAMFDVVARRQALVTHFVGIRCE